MPYCPQCRDEYVEGIARCPDCDVDLVEELTEALFEEATPAVDGPVEEALPGVTIAHHPDLAGAEALVALLFGRGIPARVGATEAQIGQPESGWPIEVPPEFEAMGARILATASEREDVDPEEMARDLTLLELSPAALRREGEAGVAGLVRLLVRGQGEAVTRAALLLARLEGAGVTALLEALVEAVAGDASAIATAAVKALRSHGRVELPPGLADLTRSERPEVRIRALRVMAGLGGAESVPHALALLRDEDKEVREEAADAIWELSKGQIDLDLDRDPRDVEEDIRILEERHGR